MNSIDKLTELFSKFPGIGPRQAKRFVYFLLSREDKFSNELIKNISEIKKEIKTCSVCFRFFPKSLNRKSEECNICLDQTRSNSSLIIISRDIDLENIEKAKVFQGKYFVLGGIVPFLEKEPEKKVRIKELLKTVKEKAVKQNLKEVILAFNPDPEGENTAEFVKDKLKTLSDQHPLKILSLGKGLSTGMELEYSDSETIKHALENKR